MSFTPEYPTLGKFSPQLEQLVRVTASPDPEELRAAYSRIGQLERLLFRCETFFKESYEVNADGIWADISDALEGVDL